MLAGSPGRRPGHPSGQPVPRDGADARERCARHLLAAGEADLAAAEFTSAAEAWLADHAALAADRLPGTRARRLVRRTRGRRRATRSPGRWRRRAAGRKHSMWKP